MTKRLDVKNLESITGTLYPPPFDEPCRARKRTRLGDPAGLTQFGVNLCRLPPGAWSSQRHWHSAEDEFVWVLSGEVTLVSDEGEQVLRAGDCATFPKSEANGHHLINNSDVVAVVLEVGTRSAEDVCEYPDIDMRIDARVGHYTHRDGTPYPPRS